MSHPTHLTTSHLGHPTRLPLEFPRLDDLSERKFLKKVATTHAELTRLGFGNEQTEAAMGACATTALPVLLDWLCLEVSSGMATTTNRQRDLRQHPYPMCRPQPSYRTRSSRPPSAAGRTSIQAR